MITLYRGQLVFAAALLLQLAGASQAASFLQNGQGLLSMEAENAHRNILQGSDQWTSESSPGGFSGTGVMVPLPNNRTIVSSGFVNNSPRLDFDVTFTQTGTHYLWIRANAPSFSDDSVHAGLNGQETPTATGIWLPGGGYTWSGGNETITIENLGLNTINLWMREDGARIDKIVLTTDASFVPDDVGPAESPQDSGGNQSPVAQNDTFSILQGSSANNFAVLADNGNGADSDPNVDPLLVLSVGATSHGGTAVVNGDGNGVTYTPLATFTGQETFSYTISDGQGGTDSATVTVTVDPVGGGNQPPVAENDTFSVLQGSSATNLAVLANNGNGADSDPESNPLTVLSVGTTSAGGTAEVNGSNNGVTYTPLATFTGQETFSYTIDDGQGGNDSATVTVNVNPTGGGAGGFLQDAQGWVSMEAENAHRNIPRGSDQWVSESSPGGFSGTGVMVPLPNNGTRVSSGFTTNSPQLDFDVSFTETGTHYLWIRANAPGFSDDSVHVGLNGQETPTATGIWLPGGGYTWSGGNETITIQNTGLNTINLWMREDGARIDKIVLTTDASFVPTGVGPTESPRDSGGNQPPVAQNDIFSVLQGSSATNLAVLANNGNGADSDPDGNPITVLSVGTTSAGGTAVVNGSNNGVTYTPLATFTGQEIFSYTIDDGQGGSDSATVTVNVNPVGGGNEPPVAQNDTFSVLQGSSATNLAVLGNNGNGADSDPDGDPLTVLSVGTTSNGGTAVVNGSGDGVTYTPQSSFSGSETFSYTISDGQGGNDSATVTVNVNPVGGGGGNGEFLQDGQGLVSMEAENAQRNIPQGSDQWTSESSPGGFSGTGVMVPLPNNGTIVSSGFTTNSPQLDFDVSFTETGTHYLWIRANAPGFSDDSVHVGLNGQENPTATGIWLPGGGYNWSGGNETITIQNTGLNTINLWMREDGAIIDKIVLTTDPDFQPTGIGPAESPRASACPVFPSVSMITPTQGHIQSSRTLTAEAQGCLDPVQHSNWGVLFELDGGPSAGGSEQLDFSEPFTATFDDVSKAEHTVGAFVVDGSGSKVGGVGTSDVESNVGIGDYYVAIGDSITVGVGDDFVADNTSLDGRNTGGGYTPVLNNLLTANRGYPHTVENEGIEGITSAGGLQALPAVIAAHPEAQRYLVKYGMNDARPGLPVPSGLGLDPGDPGYPGTFKANMQNIINLITDPDLPGAPKEVVLAKVNIALGDGAFTGQYPDPDQGARSMLIKQYNQVIDELTVITDNNANSTGGGTGGFLQDAQGLVSMEAENAQRNIPQGSDQWTPESSPGGFSGTGVMVALPNNGTRVSSGFTTNSPQLDFDVTFTETGTHYLWIRANAPGFSDDSVHVGLNGEETPTATGIWLPGGGYTWSGGNETITIQNTGLNTINLWMREDGARIDKIVLTTDASFVPFVPDVVGPAESPQDSGGNQPPVAQNDTFSVLQGSSDSDLAVLANDGNGDPLTVLSVGTTSAGGTAVVNGSNNGVTYTPLATFSGQETFSYTISDGQGGSDSATVTVTVWVVPPDFYSYFQLNYPTEYSDNVHPNGVGYQSMGNLWLQVIVP